jgi:hypothetical protein
MKFTKLVFAIALVASFASAQPKPAENKPSVVLVIASNPAIPGGVVIATSIAQAQIDVMEMTSLDPVCNAVPQLCQARAAATVYKVIYSNGTEEVF